MRADDVIVIDDDGDEVQVEVPAPEAPPLSIKIEHEDIPQDSEEPDGPVLRRGTRTGRRDSYSLLCTTKGPYHKVVGFIGSGEDPGVMFYRVRHQF